MKKRIIAIALPVILISLIALGSTAYFIADGKATNVVTTHSISMSLKDGGSFQATGTDGIYELSGTLMPSQSVQKTVAIQNDGPEPFYTRVKVDIDIRDSSGKAMDDSFDQYVDLDFQSSDWQKSGDWWYCKAPTVAAKSSTRPIFTTVLLRPDTPNELKDAKIAIVVTAQAVQSKNNPVPTDGITHVAGWPAP